MAWRDSKTELSAHTAGAPRGEARLREVGPEPGRDGPGRSRTARDSTSINAKERKPIDPRMPDMPPA